ncbi:hypothetical protein DNTS_014527 [Danionella cerebrum]|uniref:CMP-N-acetylneuraminate-beta-galactosamide-alpha-2,3-sialyltransferase 1 n=1 Tax=Danionella cerebrum TaxID=2873325 RepID=A0A553QCC6_9TELE|nr:hypothetical protein DNTS_014527 [Danionella translucida]
MRCFGQERRGAEMRVLRIWRGLYLIAAVGVIMVCMHLVFDHPPDELEALCACGACVRDRTHSTWFNDLYNASVQPLLTRENHKLRRDVYKYWKGLQKSRDEDNYRTVVEKMFSLFPDRSQYADASPNRCRTCAVIGNSGNLKGSRYGRYIDLHEFVIRINMGPTKGFEKDVGTKTTHRFIYPESAVDLENSTHLVLAPFKLLDMEWLVSVFTTKNITRARLSENSAQTSFSLAVAKAETRTKPDRIRPKLHSTYKKVKPSIAANRDKVMVLHPAFIKYVHEEWLLKRGKYPSTGFLAIIFALHVCDQVSTLGFGADQYGNWYHYFEKTPRNLRTGAHSGSFEFDTMMQLYLETKIQVFRGR